MRVDDLIRKSVVYVGDANNKTFVPHGTGFIVATYIGEYVFQSIVTAKHVLEGIAPQVHLRVNRLGASAHVINTDRSAWMPHPDSNVDLVACPTVIPHGEFEIMHVDLDGDFAYRDHKSRDGLFGLGDEAIVAGMFQQHLGESRNIPIVRVGTIAAIPEEKIRTAYGYHDVYLIEVRSIDGLSGSPVFAATSLMRLSGGKIGPPESVNVKFIGVLLGHDEVINRKDRIGIKPDGSDLEEGVRTMLNTGIGLVAPADLVIETVKQPVMEERRQEVAERKSSEDC